MPIYEYQCDACGHILDALQKFDDASLKKCPDCGKPKLKRLLSAPMFLLKGTGWYETDFKSDKERRKNLADRPEKEEKKEEKPDSKAAPAAADAAKTDAKSDAKAEPTKTEPAKVSRPTRKRTLRKSKAGKR